MDKDQQNNMLLAAKELFEQKGISQEETQAYLEEIFVKAFERDGRFNIDEPIPEGKVVASIDLDKGIIEVTRTWTIVEEVEDDNRLIHLAIDSELLEGKDVKVGEEYIENIDLPNIPYGKAQHIKQLLIQKTREAEKMKLYDQFKDRKGTLVRAKIFKTTEKFTILEYEGVSIFMPSSEYLPTDNFKIGESILVYIIEIEKVSKDAQIIGSRANPQFVYKLLEKEIEDVQDGIVSIQGISRVPGTKTKLAVSSTMAEVDPIGSIIGVKGKKIAPIIEELNGERIDIIKFDENLEQYIAEALLPATIEGVFVKPLAEEGDKKEVVVVVNQENFLPALGKRGVNVMLAAKLTGVKIDVKTIEEAEKEGIEFVKVTKSQSPAKRSFSNNAPVHQDFDLDELELEELAELDSDDDQDYGYNFEEDNEE